MAGGDPPESRELRGRALPPRARLVSSWARQQASGAHPLLYDVCPRKNQKKTFGTKRLRLEAKPGQEHFCSQAERFCRGYFPPGGGNRRHRQHQRPSHRGRANLHQHLHQHHLISNPSSSLVFNLCLKTLDWYLWVASSVDYILQLMLVDLFGGILYVQILNDIQHPSDLEHEYDL